MVRTYMTPALGLAASRVVILISKTQRVRLPRPGRKTLMGNQSEGRCSCETCPGARPHLMPLDGAQPPGKGSRDILRTDARERLAQGNKTPCFVSRIAVAPRHVSHHMQTRHLAGRGGKALGRPGFGIPNELGVGSGPFIVRITRQTSRLGTRRAERAADFLLGTGWPGSEYDRIRRATW